MVAGFLGPLDELPLATTFVTTSSANSLVGPLSIGPILGGRYEVTGLLGSGGMNAVYDGRDVSAGRRVAIKAPLFHAYAPLLLAEARALAALQSPRFPTLYAIEQEGDVPLVIMERLVGTTLAQELDDYRHTGAKMPVGDVTRFLSEIADALAIAHANGLSHRDLKPSNVMIVGSRVVLFDLGLAIPEANVSPEQIVAGSVQYIAPEVVLGEVARGNGPLVDLYSLGVIAYELLTGNAPFDGDDTEGVLARHVSAPIPDVREHREDVSATLSGLVTELLAKDPADRPASAESVLWQLRAIEMQTERPMRVVVIDDEPRIGSTLKASLESAFPRLSVETTTNAGEWLRESARAWPDIFLVDLHMPECNGIEVCMSLLADPSRRRPTIVAMSAHADERDIEVFRNLGVNDFVPKDGAFIRRVSDVIGRMRERRS